MPRKTTKRTSRKGAGLKDLLKKGHDYVKEKKLISKVISELGYGAKRKRRPLLVRVASWAVSSEQLRRPSVIGL